MTEKLRQPAYDRAHLIFSLIFNYFNLLIVAFHVTISIYNFSC